MIANANMPWKQRKAEVALRREASRRRRPIKAGNTFRLRKSIGTSSVAKTTRGRKWSANFGLG